MQWTGYMFISSENLVFLLYQFLRNNAVLQFGNSILAGAVRSGNVEIVRLLLEKHADVNARDSVCRCFCLVTCFAGDAHIIVFIDLNGS